MAKVSKLCGLVLITEEWMPACIFGIQSIMMWGCISNDGVDPLLITEGSVTGIGKNAGTFCKSIFYH